MLEYLETLKKWSGVGKSILMARVIRAKGSSPRPMGSMMFMNSDGELIGSVSGGCVEGEIVKLGIKILNGGGDSRKLSFGISDEKAWGVGLPCGGAIQTFIQKINLKEPIWKKLVQSIETNTPCALITSLKDDGCKNTLYLMNEQKRIGDEEDFRIMVSKAYHERSHKIETIDGIPHFIQIFPEKSLLIVIGAAHITADLVAFGNEFGFRTIVIDPRGFFADRTVFKSPPDEILREYPSEVLGNYRLDQNTYCALLSHDPKIDDDGLEFLISKKVAYIGILESKKRHERRMKKLSQTGFTDEDISRIHGPIGLPINSVSAKEIALSIMAEIVKVKNEYFYKYLRQ